MAPAITVSLAWPAEATLLHRAAPAISSIPASRNISINGSDVSGIDFSGSQQSTHSVQLTWLASTSSVVGYNIYRSITTGGPYVKINATLVMPLTYTDSSLANSTTYYYVATSVDPTGNESAYSIETSANTP